jgi:glycosyltransferase involved in cell wall biosynthesis
MTSQSMPRFAQMLTAAYKQLGHEVSCIAPQARVRRYFAATRLAKWAGYVDQYLLFPRVLRRAARQAARDTLFVFCDQAMGPWVPAVASRPHAIHVHDLLALRSALGDIKENPTSISGRLYQRYIRRGFRRGRHFICISQKTRADLQQFGLVEPTICEVVYNGVNYPYTPMPREEAQRILLRDNFPSAPQGVLLHVGGNQWYKNRRGLIELYARYVASEATPLPLWLIGPSPDATLRQALKKVGAKGSVLFFQDVKSETLQAAYSYAKLLLFPSFAEGFGWPLIEAQACGCPVLTTKEAPMTEVAGETAFYIPRLEAGGDIDAWTKEALQVLKEALAETEAERARRVERGRIWSNKFNSKAAIDSYLGIYRAILAEAVQ